MQGKKRKNCLFLFIIFLLTIDIILVIHDIIYFYSKQWRMSISFSFYIRTSFIIFCHFLFHSYFERRWDFYRNHQKWEKIILWIFRWNKINHEPNMSIDYILFFAFFLFTLSLRYKGKSTFFFPHVLWKNWFCLNVFF